MQELTVRDVDHLLLAYKHTAALKQSEHLRQHQSLRLDQASVTLPGRFCHCTSSSLTLDNVKSLLTEYQHSMLEPIA